MTYAPGNYPADKPNRPDKGKPGGSCNVTACQLPKSAAWFNHSTRKYYCEDCATVLNRENRADAARLFGHELCTEEKAISRNLNTKRNKRRRLPYFSSIERSLRRVYNPPPVRENYPSRQSYRRAVKEWIAKYGPLPPAEEKLEQKSFP